MFRRNSKRYDLPNGRLSDNAALIASINGTSFGGFASISTLTANLWSDAAYRADGRDERSAKTLFKRRPFAIVLRDGEKVARLRRAGERDKIDLIATKRADQP